MTEHELAALALVFIALLLFTNLSARGYAAVCRWWWGRGKR